MTFLVNSERLNAIRRCGVADGSPDEALDRLTRIAAAVTGAPVAFATVVDANRQVLAGAHGLAPGAAREQPIAWSFCRHVVEADDVLLVADSRSHPLVGDNPAVEDLGVAAYLGVPLRFDGHAIGALCAIDHAPRTWTPLDVALLTDVADAAAKALEHTYELRASEERLSAIVDAAPMVLFVLDREGRFELTAGRGLQRLGTKPNESVGVSVFDLYADEPEIVDAARRALAGETVTLTVELEDVGAFETTYRPLIDDGGVVQSVIGVATDVTEGQRSKTELERLAYHDGLTGLPNRQAIEQRLERTLAAARRSGDTAALVFVDLDQFKVVNDSLGHAAGDDLLGQVAERLCAAVRPGDLVARQGGDEFMILLDSLGSDPDGAATSVAERVTDALTEPFTVSGTQFHVTASVGVSLYPRHGEYPSELLRHADVAMYEAKRAGRNTTCIYRPGVEVTRERLTLGSRLRRAIDRDELVLHYQPVYDLRTCTPIGVEALVRWQDPERGLIPPLHFIPHAEEHGLIDLIGTWVLEEVCRQGAEWATQGLLPQLGFNVSPRQLKGRGFVERVACVTARHGIAPSRLTVELTESAVMADEDGAMPVLTALDELGVHLAIDDFGTGHSSLARLRDLPVHSLKIDRAFLRDLPGDERASELVGGMLALGRALRLGAIAEGIEDQAQIAFLLEHGCVHGQGFGLSRPLDADAATQLLAAAHLVAA